MNSDNILMQQNREFNFQMQTILMTRELCCRSAGAAVDAHRICLCQCAAQTIDWVCNRMRRIKTTPGCDECSFSRWSRKFAALLDFAAARISSPPARKHSASHRFSLTSKLHSTVKIVYNYYRPSNYKVFSFKLITKCVVSPKHVHSIWPPTQQEQVGGTNDASFSNFLFLFGKLRKQRKKTTIFSNVHTHFTSR